MEHDFWHQKWQEGRIGFHQVQINPYLKKYWTQLALQGEEKIFVPLCGKTRDMLWLREQGHEVVGVELNESACSAFFEENNTVPQVRQLDKFTARCVDGIELLCGDFFALEQEHLGPIAAIYDRAALIALPFNMRKQYADHLSVLLPAGGKILLVTLEFAGDAGPPFSVSAEEVVALFGERFDVYCMARLEPDDPRDAGRTEVTWLLQSK